MHREWDMNEKFPDKVRDASDSSMSLLNLPQSEMSQSDNVLLFYAQDVKGSCAFQKDDSYQLALIRPTRKTPSFRTVI